MYLKIVAGLVLLLLIWLAVSMKVRSRTRATRGTIPADTKETLFSLALAELVATAGGIYVSLLLLFSFLDLASPGKISLAGLQVDALAGLSMAVALIQPIVLAIMKKRIV